MAEDGSVAVEVAFATVNQETLSPQENQEVIGTKKSSELEPDQKDSRSTNPDGAQSVSGCRNLLEPIQIHLPH